MVGRAWTVRAARRVHRRLRRGSRKRVLPSPADDSPATDCRDRTPRCERDPEPWREDLARNGAGGLDRARLHRITPSTEGASLAFSNCAAARPGLGPLHPHPVVVERGAAAGGGGIGAGQDVDALAALVGGIRPDTFGDDDA